ncbi:VWA domain-containing protein [Gordonia jinhuaensis]|uniref:VWA domain-containing protein n=1 Tax=Gordonia jinhuaensis TaxID=1517702 RepID=A0A916SYC2_9ACTN|nr:VWA domain-containing protein [Gordonia jinhuaensis]GGB22103.1 VWA domain-containing protein [Gordonia jinhuaensis]
MTSDAVVSGAHLVDHLAEFVEELRRRGIDASATALIDAAQAMAVLDLLDRESLREGLAATLLDDHLQRPAFDVLFDLWFPAGERVDTRELRLPTDSDGNVDTSAAREQLAQLLADPDAEADGRLATMVAMMVEEFGKYTSTRGEAYSAYQANTTIDPQTLIAAIAAAMAADAGDDADGTQARYRSAARDRAATVRAMVETETQRRMAGVRGRDSVAAHAVPQLAQNIAFLSAGAAKQAQIRKTIPPLARLLAARLETRRRRSHHGAIDIRRTLRASMSSGGVPIDLVRRKPRPGRPELAILCDVSGSVAGFSQFTLHLASALRQEFSRVRVFAFVDTVDEVTDYFERRGADSPDFGTSMAAMLSQARLITLDGHSDYGHAFTEFATRYADSLTRRGALLILGDARTNYGDPRVAVLAKLVDQARHAYWLNPEPKENWDTGDSVASTYGEVIEMFECRTAGQLGEVIAGLLPV